MQIFLFLTERQLAAQAMELVKELLRMNEQVEPEVRERENRARV